MSQERINNDQELFLLIADGDEAAFSDLYYKYLPRIYPVILKMVGTEAVVKDVVQEVFLNIWISRHKLREVDSPANWIFRIVYNHTIKWLEYKGVRSRSSDQIVAEPAGNLTEEMVSFARTSRLVKEAVHHLPGQAKRIYTLSREGGLSIASIAKELNLSPQTVKNSLTRSVKMIQEYLTRHGVFVPLILLTLSLS